MRIKTEVGQIAITLNDKQYIFTPTLKAMGDIAQPGEIIDLLVLLGTNGYNDKIPNCMIKQAVRDTTKRLWYAATTVLESCCDSVTSHLWGYYIGSRYVVGIVPIKNIITLGRALIESGIVGKPTPQKGDKQAQVNEWYADDYITLAVNQLGVSRAEAEQLTMIQLQRGLNLLNPVDEKDKPIVVTEQDEMAMDNLMNKFMGSKK